MGDDHKHRARIFLHRDDLAHTRAAAWIDLSLGLVPDTVLHLSSIL